MPSSGRSGILVVRWDAGIKSWSHSFRNQSRSLPVLELALTGRIQISLLRKVCSPWKDEVTIASKLTAWCLSRHIILQRGRSVNGGRRGRGNIPHDSRLPELHMVATCSKIGGFRTVAQCPLVRNHELMESKRAHIGYYWIG